MNWNAQHTQMINLLIQQNTSIYAVKVCSEGVHSCAAAHMIDATGCCVAAHIQNVWPLSANPLTLHYGQGPDRSINSSACECVYHNDFGVCLTVVVYSIASCLPLAMAVSRWRLPHI